MTHFAAASCAGTRRIAGDAVARGRLRILDGELHMIEAGVGERLHALLRQPDAGGDQIGVKADEAQ